jgi:Icc-related predicted phosphoesterase
MQPVLCLTGHIHEGRGMDSIGRNRVVNPGVLSRGGYVYARVGRRVEEREIHG